MSVVIVGGNECMARRYLEVCQDRGWKAKVFVKEKGLLKRKIGSPDLIVLLMSTVSHKMVESAVAEGKRCNARIERALTSSVCALESILAAQAAG